MNILKEKKKNLIILGVEESNSEDGYERKQYDNDCCKELFQVLEIKEENRKVDMVYRLGRKNQGEDGNVGEGAGSGEREQSDLDLDRYSLKWRTKK